MNVSAAIRSTRSFVHKMKERDLSLHASGITFFLFLSMIPILMLVTALLPLTPLSRSDLMRTLLAVIPEETQYLALGLVDQLYENFAGILPIALVTAVFSAGKGMLALMRAFNTLYGLPERRGYIRLRIAASINTVLFLGAILISLGLGVFGEKLLTILSSYRTGREGEEPFWNSLRGPLVFVLLFAVFLFLYTFIPDRKQKILRQLPGALFSAVGWSICSWGFSWYVQTFSSLTAYGSLGTVTVFLLWLYFFCYILLLGAVVNIFLENNGYF